MTLGDVTVTPGRGRWSSACRKAASSGIGPRAVTVERAGSVRHLRVVDITRLLQLALLALAAVIAAAAR
jgi:hypothetical protein